MRHVKGEIGKEAVDPIISIFPFPFHVLMLLEQNLNLNLADIRLSDQSSKRQGKKIIINQHFSIKTFD